MLHATCAGQCQVCEPAKIQSADGRGGVDGVSGMLSRAILHRADAVGSCERASRHGVFWLCLARLAATTRTSCLPQRHASHTTLVVTATHAHGLLACTSTMQRFYAVPRWLLPLVASFYLVRLPPGLCGMCVLVLSAYTH